MGASRKRLLRVACASLASTCLPAIAVAAIPAAPSRQSIDGSGVDVVRGTFNTDTVDVSIGPADGRGLSYKRYWRGDGGWQSSVAVTISGSSAKPVISFGGNAESFTLYGSVYVSDNGDGSTLVKSASNAFTFTSRDGVVISFKPADANNGLYDSPLGRVDTVTSPDGVKTRYYYEIQYTSYTDPGGSGTYSYPYIRLYAVSNSQGYQLRFSYAAGAIGYTPFFDNRDQWLTVAKVTALNSAVQYCDPAQISCTPDASWPSVTYTASNSAKITSVTNAAAQTVEYGYDTNGRLNKIKRQSASVNDVDVTYDAAYRVATVKRAGQSWSYGFADDSVYGVRKTTATDPLGHAQVTTSNLSTYLVQDVTSENGASYKTSYFYVPGTALLQKVMMPEGNSVEYAHDGRGNVTSTTVHAKAGSGLADLVTSATYGPSCTAATAATCNKPVTTTDATGAVTNYEYEASGLVTSVKLPAVGGVRPETRYSYTSGNALLKNSGGTFTASTDAVRLLQTVSTCRTSTSCAGTADEIRATYSYAVPAGTGSNLLVTSSTVQGGTGSPLATTSYGYDAVRNVVSTTDPLGNVSQARYNAARQLVSSWTADPDGTGARKARGLVNHYLADGSVDTVSVGSINADGTGFAAVQVTTIGYDGYGRKVQERVNPASNLTATAAYGLTEYSYDALGRLDCTAVRMTPSTYAASSAPAACTQVSAPGSNGPDRISQMQYDNAGQPLVIKTGVGVSGLARNEVTYTYNLNGQVTSVTDAKGNITSTAYDAHLRPIRTCYNAALSACTDGTATDTVQVNYGTSGTAKGRVESRTVRGIPSMLIGYTYDALGRVTNISYPGGGFADQPVTMGYDLVGNLLTATDASGHSASYEYDALGRVTSQGDAVSTRTMQYDAGGRRTSFAWSGGPTITYTYDNTDQVTAIKEGTTTSLASFEYDDLGRRTKLTRGNGVVTNYSYNDGSQLTTLGLDLAGTASDQSYTFGYNPAGQILTRGASNDAYAWTQHYNVNRPYSANALNQYSAIGAAPNQLTPVYDVKGNLASTGGPTYSYDTKNELVQVSDSGTKFYFDPTGRLDTIMNAAGQPTTRFQYDGDHIADELDGASNVLRRYVWGPGADEPLVWYEGSGTTTKRYLVADERGSVVAVTDGAGNPITINAYDEYGIPNSTNQGRFQYTGQAWIPELGMYHYKARTYSPTLGRFMQTDPIGYGDGPNWYDYVHGDPVNGVDPSGLQVTYVPGNTPNDEGELGVTAGSGGWLSSLLRGFTDSAGIYISDGGNNEGVKRCLEDADCNHRYFGGPPPSAAASEQSPTDTAPQSLTGRLANPRDTCGIAERGLQKLGQIGVDVGGSVTSVGVGGVIAGIGVTVGSPLTGPAAPFTASIGATLTAGSLAVASGGGTITAIGAGLKVLGGSGKDAIVESISRGLTRPIPGGPLKELVSEALNGFLGAVLPEVKSCR